jgi:methylthioribose-1-phosphate isomerase
MKWSGQALELLDQRRLPLEERWLRLETWHEVAEAIRDMAVRGAPAIGIAAGYGLALAARTGEDLESAAEGLRATRPTAVNLQWALDRILALGVSDFETVLQEARRSSKRTWR